MIKKKFMAQNENSTVDLSCLNEYTDGDPEVMKELIQLFFTSFDESLDNLKEEATDGQNIEWSNIAHKLKGASAYVGAEQLRSLCAQGQSMEDAQMNDRKMLVQQIETTYKTVQSELQSLIA